jgi:hypothetical protein
MSGHRVELHVAFTVGDPGREAAEAVLRQLEYLGDHGQLDNYTSDFTVTRGTVDGNDWEDKWPDRSRTSADTDAALASGMDTYNAIDSAIDELRELQSDVRETMKTISYLRNRRNREQEPTR